MSLETEVALGRGVLSRSFPADVQKKLEENWKDYGFEG